MKSKRQSTLLKLIDRYDISTQLELTEFLNKEGFNATQATVSRDIKELRLVKTVSSNGKSKYTVSKSATDAGFSDRLLAIFKESVLSFAIVTSRSMPSHFRVIKTLRKWGVYVDEAYFLGGLRKDELLKAFGAHIFFDDQDTHLTTSSKYVPSGKVPYHSSSQIIEAIKEKKEAENG